MARTKPPAAATNARFTAGDRSASTEASRWGPLTVDLRSARADRAARWTAR